MTSEVEKIFAQGDRSRAPLEQLTKAVRPSAEAAMLVGSNAGWHPRATASRALYAFEIILNDILVRNAENEADIAARAATKQDGERATIAAGLGIPKEDLN